MKTNFAKTISLLALFTIAFTSIQCSNNDAPSNSSTVNFTIDGVSYQGMMIVQPSQSAGCSTSKNALITDNGTNTISIMNYKQSSGTVFDAFDSSGSCTALWIGVVLDGGNTSYFSTSGTWQVSGTTFTLNCTANSAFSGINHIITATGKLQ